MRRWTDMAGAIWKRRIWRVSLMGLTADARWMLLFLKAAAERAFGCS